LEGTVSFETLRSNLRQIGFTFRAVGYVLGNLREGKQFSPAKLVESHARSNPDGAAILFESRRVSNADLDRAANRYANALASLGAKKGDVVALVMDNRPEYVIAIVGGSKIGVITSLVNTHVGGAQLEHALRICSPKFILAGSEHAQKLEEIRDGLPVPVSSVLVQADGDDATTLEGAQRFDSLLAASSDANPGKTDEQRAEDALLYIYTSGTTGFPKAALWRNDRFFRAAGIFGRVLLRIDASHVVYSAGLPMYHSSGVVLGWGVSLAGGATFAMRRKFSASGHWEDCERFGATHFMYIGELCRYLYNAPPHPKERAHRLQAILGAGLRPEIWEGFQERFGIPKIYEFYGATEGNVGLVNIDCVPGMMGRLQRDHDVFRALPGTAEIERGADGRAVKAKPGEKGILVGRITKMNRFDGYVDKKKNEEKVLKNPLGDGHDFFNTGDLVKLHDRRWVSFVDRLGDTFRWKGENVSTNEVQEVLNRFEGVRESNVFGVEVPHTDGRAGMAAMVVGDDFDTAAFSDYVKRNLPAYARPLFLRLQREMKVTATFKHVKTDLREDGFDPAKAGEDRLLFLDESGYVPLDGEIHRSIVMGERRL
jgi:acyl-CoA synthetase (AMP-forming)/AMP-acid ligase II